jgi:ABC-2 type transport system permease protein
VSLHLPRAVVDLFPLRAIWAYLRVALMVAIQYRATFLAEAALAFAWVAWSILPLLVVFQYADGIEGWTRDQAFLVVGFFTILEGILAAFIDPNLRAVVEQVRDGTFDFTLLKPLDAQLQVSIHRLRPTEIPHLLAGVVVVALAASRLPEWPSALQVGQAALLLLFGTMTLHALWTVVVATSFWFVKVDNLSVLLHTFIDTGRWPVSFFSNGVRIFLTFVLPVGIMTTYPAMALRGTLDPSMILRAGLVALLFVVGARAVWSYALRHYTSASS